MNSHAIIIGMLLNFPGVFLVYAVRALEKKTYSKAAILTVLCLLSIILLSVLIVNIGCVEGII